MPTFDFMFWTQGRQGFLGSDGPLIPVEISVPLDLEKWFAKNNLPVPSTKTGYGLIDTGASISGVFEPVLKDLSIIPIDTIPLNTPGGDKRANVYPVRVSFPALNVTGYHMNRIVGNEANWKTADGKDVIMLVGRDILSQFVMIYNGKFNMITLAY